MHANEYLGVITPRYAVAYERSSKLNLTEFYRKYHLYLSLIYHEGKYWRVIESEFPDLKEITEFNIMLESEEFLIKS